tara:strand:- start:9041 stop:9919 length:879 start_codon:yes stop_codon:yes gene_type:complete
MQLPITSRVKRSPLFKTKQSDNAIDPKDPKSTRGGKEEGEDVEVQVETEVENPKLTEFKDRCAKYGGKNSAAAAADGCVWSDDAKDPEPITKKETKVEKGPDLDYEGTLMEETTGRRLGPQEIRANQRSTKKIQRDIRRAKIKAAKKKGILTPELRKQYKKEEAEAELADFEAAAENQSTAMASGKGRNESFVSGQRERNQGKDTPTEQTEEFKRKARRDAAKNQNITTSDKPSQASQAITSSGSLSDMASNVDNADFSTGYVPFTGGSGINMLSSVAKRSPYKMKGHPGKR